MKIVYTVFSDLGVRWCGSWHFQEAESWLKMKKGVGGLQYCKK